MTVFIAHAEADRAAAEALEKFLERRGLFVELENGERGFRFAQPADAVIVLWSKEMMFSPYRLQFEKRTLEAWADEQLVMVRLDHAFAPVGLRDLPAIDAKFEAQRDIAWAAAARAAQELRHPKPQAPAALEQAPPAEAPPAEPRVTPMRTEKRVQARRRGGSVWGILGAVLLLLALALALGAGALWVSGAAPSLSLERLSAFAPGPLTIAAIAGGAAVACMIALLIGAMRKPSRLGDAGDSEAQSPTRTAPGAVLFVSYARADDERVAPVVRAFEAAGRRVWIDKQIGAGEGWAAEIVRAIKSAERVVVMCSARAFESDHVKREVYLADRYKKPMLPIFLETAAPPEDFEYFFAGVQWLELHHAGETEREALIARALAA